MTDQSRPFHLHSQTRFFCECASSRAGLGGLTDRLASAGKLCANDSGDSAYAAGTRRASAPSSMKSAETEVSRCVGSDCS